MVDSGEDALTRLADDTRATGVVLLDVMLPGIDGWQVLHHLRARMRACPVPVIITSALDPYDTHHEAVTRGADAFISKPFTGTALVKVIERVLRQTTAASQNEPQGLHDEA